MAYLPTLGEKCLHSKGNVSKYSLHEQRTKPITPAKRRG